MTESIEGQMSRFDQERHDGLVDYLFNKPYRIGVDPYAIITKSKDFELWGDGELKVVPDIYIATELEDLYVEVKGTPSSLTNWKGKRQMQKMYECLENHLSRRNYEIMLVQPRVRSNNIETLAASLVVDVYEK